MLSRGITTSSSNSSLKPRASTKRMPNIAYIYSWVTCKIFNVTLSHTTEIFRFQILQLMPMERDSPRRPMSPILLQLRSLLIAKTSCILRIGTCLVRTPVFHLALIFKHICKYAERGGGALFGLGRFLRTTSYSVSMRLLAIWSRKFVF